MAVWQTCSIIGLKGLISEISVHIFDLGGILGDVNHFFFLVRGFRNAH